MRVWGLIAALVVLLGCVLGLAVRFRAPETPMRGAQALSSAYDQLAVGATPASQLRRLGFDTRNATRISELGMVEQFVRGDSVDFDALDGSVKDCLLGRTRCDGYVFPLTDMPGTRAVVVTVKDRVAYKTLTGELLTSSAEEASRRY
jgi:hypothetical protein